MKFKDIENKSINELNDLLNDLKAESFTLGWKNKTQQQDQTHKIRLVRRDIARVLTAIRQKELNEKESSKKTSSSKVKSTTIKTKKSTNTIKEKEGDK
ncbi:MAG: 50S ribosomal protein L29 [Mycoplasma sp.]|nr:50S ribosomal protein L29 [Mycoplasma sp.]